MPNKTITFKTDILPYSDEGYNIGNSESKWKVNGYVVSAASAKGVDTSISAESSSTNLPTSAAVASFVEGKGYLSSTLKGAASGLAELDEYGKVPSSQLPAYVDDVLEFAARDNFPLTGSSGVIYVAIDTNLTYRWSGSDYVEISQSLALGTTSSTAYRGDYGNTAYTHASDANKLTTAQTSGLYKIATTAQGHIASATAVVKSDITTLGIPAQDTTYTFTNDGATLVWGTSTKLATVGGTDITAALPVSPNNDANMLATNGEVDELFNDPYSPVSTYAVVVVTDTDPVISAEVNTLYKCGEISTLSFTPPATGICEVIFTSGSSPTILTLPNTIRLPGWFSAGTLEANTTYEISFLDGLAMVGTWDVIE